ncbi:MAG: small basic family protein [Desulfotomaculum sp.]|nr:small basic family protein [Desulfotomaculum sp.]
MWITTILAAMGLCLGLFIGLNVPIILPEGYAPYLGLAVLAALDSVFGGIRAGMEDQFDNSVFLSGFFFNILLASGLAYIGERLGVPLSTAAVVAFGVRLFQNLAIIRRHILKK